MKKILYIGILLATVCAGIVIVFNKRNQKSTSTKESVLLSTTVSKDGYISKFGDQFLFRPCNEVEQYSFIQAKKDFKNLYVDEGISFVNIEFDKKDLDSLLKIKKSSNITQECLGNTDKFYLKNMFSILKEMSFNQLLSQDGDNYNEKISEIYNCPECLKYEYSFSHYAIPELRYYGEILLKDGYITSHKYGGTDVCKNPNQRLCEFDNYTKLKIKVLTTEDSRSDTREKFKSFLIELPKDWKVESSIIKNEKGIKIGQIDELSEISQGETCSSVEYIDETGTSEIVSDQKINTEGLSGLLKIIKSEAWDGVNNNQIWYPHQYCLEKQGYLIKITFYEWYLNEDEIKNHINILKSTTLYD